MPFFVGWGEVELRLRHLTDADIRLKDGIKKEEHSQANRFVLLFKTSACMLAVLTINEK